MGDLKCILINKINIKIRVRVCCIYLFIIATTFIFMYLNPLFNIHVSHIFPQPSTVWLVETGSAL